MRGDGLTREVCCDQLTSECCDQSVHTSCTHTCHQPVTRPALLQTAAEPIPPAVPEHRSHLGRRDFCSGQSNHCTLQQCTDQCVTYTTASLPLHCEAAPPAQSSGRTVTSESPKMEDVSKQHLIDIKFVVFYRSTDLPECPEERNRKIFLPL